MLFPANIPNFFDTNPPYLYRSPCKKLVFLETVFEIAYVLSIYCLLKCTFFHTIFMEYKNRLYFEKNGQIKVCPFLYHANRFNSYSLFGFVFLHESLYLYQNTLAFRKMRNAAKDNSYASKSFSTLASFTQRVKISSACESSSIGGKVGAIRILESCGSFL